jgi:hypothetical protein
MSGVPVNAAPPPSDDGRPSKGGAGGSEHAAALEQLKLARLEARGDKLNSVRILLPDAPHWTRVKFWGVPTLVGFRYGKDHHAVVAAFVTPVDAPPAGGVVAPGVCMKSFEAWAMPLVEAFDVELSHEPPRAVMWDGAHGARRRPGDVPQLVDIDSLFARTATIVDREGYAAAYAAYPAWSGACLIIGVAVPARADEDRARRCAIVS